MFWAVSWMILSTLGTDGDSAPTPALVEPPTFLSEAVADGATPRRLFESDHAFDEFVGPITNPVLAKDPRSLTEVRGLFINNWTDPKHLLGPGSYQVYAVQARVAVTERLQLFADKDGYGVFSTNGRDGDVGGWLNIAAGGKYALIRDVERQFLFDVGLQYEAPTGEARVFQGHGNGMLAVFGVLGKRVGEANFIANFGENFAMNNRSNSSFWYSQIHLDYRLWQKFYPLMEFNWYHYTSSGNRGIPAVLNGRIVGEGDGHVNIGTSDVTGNDLVTTAVGAKYVFNKHVQLGPAWEFPISNRHDLLNNRLTTELILRY